ncbi:hypothetical protein RN001_016077 [Aquatica leii]|uniref:Uncharacterized protein n=1 Tax=Aquatica leii TaxID=1421715 RepID=A0AAN7QB26_9COLE|nr:hypothetical protein RN001_016077 [Aquatica leii]
MIAKIFIYVLFVQCNIAKEAFNEPDIKELFFSPNHQDTQVPFSSHYLEFPRPGGFKNERFRRAVTDQAVVSQAERPETEDFLRNRRDTKIVENVPKERAIDISNLSQFETHENQQRTARMLLQDKINNPQEGFREPRGVVKEQWVKQPYPVRSMFPNDDSVTASTDAKAPRVHFVTQRRLESSPPVVYRTYEREGRSRDVHRDGERDLPRSASRPPPRVEYYPSERPLKRFEPFPPRPLNPYRDDAYYRYEESRYDPRYGFLENERPRSEVPTRQRRIIYYATLPEVVRTPPNVNLRNRYIYRDRFDDRYLSSPSQPEEESSYKFRKPPPYSNSRYEQEIERTKAPYPLKVSTDVSVRETKKNPERRIYSEPESRYAYKAQPYQPKETFEEPS